MFGSTKRRLRPVCILLMAVTIAAVNVATASAAPATKGDPADGLQVFTRDVFVIVGSTLRNPDDTTSANAPLFNNSGVALGITWGQWGAPTATSLMRVVGDRTRDRIALTGLVPKGVYSVFYVTLNPDSDNPLCTHVERALPLMSTRSHPRHDAASFVAHADGTAKFAGFAPGDPLAALQVVVEIVYHSDRHTYGSLPNHGEFLTQGGAACRSSFGDDAMRQLLILQKE